MRYLTGIVAGFVLTFAFAFEAHAVTLTTMIQSIGPADAAMGQLLGLIGSPLIKAIAVMACVAGVVAAALKGSVVPALMSAVILITFFVLPSMMESSLDVPPTPVVFQTAGQASATPAPKKVTDEDSGWFWMLFLTVSVATIVVLGLLGVFNSSETENETERPAVEALPTVNALPQQREESRQEQHSDQIISEPADVEVSPRNQRKVVLS